MDSFMQQKLTTAMALPGLKFDDSYKNLPERFYALVAPSAVKAPRLIKLNHALAKALGLKTEKLDHDIAAQIFSGHATFDERKLLAMTYSGHQFGMFNPQMGDGRAALIGEVIDANGKRRDIQLKGSGRTPFSKNGDGRAALGPVIREYVLSEAMYALGVATTRSLAITMTGEYVFREGPAPGAVLTRVAASHLRIGTFQFFASRGDMEGLKTLADYAVERHYSELGATDNPYLGLLTSVIAAQADLVANWMSIGFIHGVMNTDNMTISGETIDYGPCAFMDYYEHNKVYSSIDQQGRYAFGAQPNIAQWNLARLAESLIPLIDEDGELAVEKAKAALDTYSDDFMSAWNKYMAPKFGLVIEKGNNEKKRELMRRFLTLLHQHNADFTNSFQMLAEALKSDQHMSELEEAFHQDDAFSVWFKDWQSEITDKTEALALMATSNPIYIPRNHLVEEVIQAAEQDNNFEPMEQLLVRVSAPYKAQENSNRYAMPPNPDEVVQRTFCGT
ncbi:MAG: YdiU family protein [Salaquimonas sp.]